MHAVIGAIISPLLYKRKNKINSGGSPSQNKPHFSSDATKTTVLGGASHQTRNGFTPSRTDNNTVRVASRHLGRTTTRFGSLLAPSIPLNPPNNTGRTVARVGLLQAPISSPSFIRAARGFSKQHRPASGRYCHHRRSKSMAWSL